MSTFDVHNIQAVNTSLRQLKMPMLSKSQHDQLLGADTQNKLARAFPLATNDNNENATLFIRNLVDKVRGEAQSASTLPASAVYPQDLESAPQPEAQPSPAPTNTTDKEGPDQRLYLSKHVYGGKAALEFCIDETRSGAPTIAIDAAISTGPRQYDWKNKVRIQLTEAELPVVASVFFGMLPACSFQNHGPANDKGFEIEHQGRQIFVKVMAKDQGVKAVPVNPSDAYAVAGLFIRQLQEASPWMDANTIIATLGRTVAKMMSTQPTQ